MLGGDPGLDGVGAGRARCGSAAGERKAAIDLLAVPEAAILLTEGNEAVIADPGVAAGVVEEHQRQQPEHLGLLGEHRREQARQPDRLAAQILAEERVGGGAEVALVVDQIERRGDRRQPLGHLLAAGNLVADPRVADLPLRADQPLRHRALARQERPGDLRGAEPAERPQGQGDP